MEEEFGEKRSEAYRIAGWWTGRAIDPGPFFFAGCRHFERVEKREIVCVCDSRVWSRLFV
jgi:hypothetical protein